MKRFLLLFLAIYFLGCPAVSPFEEETKLPQSNSVYDALSGKAPLPPTNLVINKVFTKEGEVPTLSWNGTPQAVSYNIYRKKDENGKWEFLQTVMGDTYQDNSINGMYFSGTYYYTVTSVDMYKRESFQPNPLYVSLSDPKYMVKAELLSASQGAFEEVKEDNETIVASNKLGVLLKIVADDKIKGYQIQYRESSSSGAWDLVTECYIPDGDKIADTQSGKDVYYYVHVPNEQGVKYTYNVKAVGEGGIVGPESDEGKRDGFVYSAAKVDTTKIDSYSGNCIIPVSAEGENGGCVLSYEVKYSKNESGPYEKLNDGVETSDGKLNLNGAISTILEEDAACEVYFQVIAKYTKAGASSEAVPSEVFSVLLIKAGASEMPCPTDIKVVNGQWFGEDEENQYPKLTWSGTSDTKVKYYCVYRAEHLSYTNENDNTSWEFVRHVPVETAGGELSFTDSELPRPGGYFYKVNPSIDGSNSVATQTQNDASIDRFAKAALIPQIDIQLTVNSQSSESSIPLSWTPVNGITKFKVQQRTPSGGNWSDLTTTTSLSYNHSTATPGNFTYKIQPVIEFINDSQVIHTIDGKASSEVEGAIALSNVKWIKLVMETMMEGQATIEDRSTVFSSGGAENRNNSDGTVSWGARSYSSYGENDKYQVYRFSQYTDKNKAISIQGCLFHLYISRSGNWGSSGWKSGIGLYLTYSAPDDSWISGGFNNTTADGIDKKPGNITVTGVYPGTLQVWGKNVIAGVSSWDDAKQYYNPEKGAKGIYLTGEYTDWRSYEYSSWVADNYGFSTAMSENPGVNTSTAYSIKRNSETSFTNYSYSQVGALQ